MYKNGKLYPWAVVGMLWVVALLNYLDRQILSTMRGVMQVDIEELASADTFAHLMGIFLIVYGLVSPAAGVIADRVSRKWVIVVSLFVWSSVTLLTGYATTYHEIFWLRAAMGVSEAVYIPAGLSLIADYHKGSSRSLAVGLHMSGLYVGSALGGFGTTISYALPSWHDTFIWFGLVGIVYALMLMIGLRDKKEKKAPIPATDTAEATHHPAPWAKPFYKNRSFWILLAYFAIPSLPGWAIKNWLPTHFEHILDLPMSQAGPLATIIIAASSLVGVLFGGRMADKWVKSNLHSRVWVGGAGLFLTIPALVLLSVENSLITAVSAGLLFGVGFGMFDANNMPILCQFVPSKQRGRAYGLMNTAGVCMGYASTRFLGKLEESKEFDMSLGFTIFAALVAVVLIGQLSFLRPKTDNMAYPSPLRPNVTNT